MSKAKYRSIKRGSNSSRFVVSEGSAPSEYLLAHPGLPTFYTWQESNDDERMEVVIPQGTVLSAIKGVDGITYVVPQNGSGSAFTWGDGQAVNVQTGATPASASGTNSDTIVVPPESVPIGCAQADVLRPFDRNASMAASWTTFGYVEVPLVSGLNSDFQPGDLVKTDAMGRMVKAAVSDFDGGKDYLRIGKVVQVERFGVNFDDGLLSYMELPADAGALLEVYSITRDGANKGLFGVPKNLDVANSVGAVRVSLSLT
jgi:hypothetical protein